MTMVIFTFLERFSNKEDGRMCRLRVAFTPNQFASSSPCPHLSSMANMPVVHDVYIHSADVLVINKFRTISIMQNIVRDCYQKNDIWFINIDQKYCCRARSIHVIWRMYGMTTKKAVSKRCMIESRATCILKASSGVQRTRNVSCLVRYAWAQISCADAYFREPTHINSVLSPRTTALSDAVP
jgi:hypothetical protein